jgi:hypothetical protein
VSSSSSSSIPNPLLDGVKGSVSSLSIADSNDDDEVSEPVFVATDTELRAEAGSGGEQAKDTLLPVLLLPPPVQFWRPEHEECLRADLYGLCAGPAVIAS